jgi:Uncharacterised protein family (UPF0158)
MLLVKKNLLNLAKISLSRNRTMESRDSFMVMEDLSEKVNDIVLQEKLFNALNRKHPFREFKFVIDNSGEYRNAWFDFKNKRYFEWVENQLATHNNL